MDKVNLNIPISDNHNIPILTIPTTEIEVEKRSLLEGYSTSSRRVRVEEMLYKTPGPEFLQDPPALELNLSPPKFFCI